MTSKVHISLLERLKSDLDGITLCQDKDSAHDSKAINRWAKEEGIDLLTLPGKSPDFSIIESLAQPVKNLFHAERTASQKAALNRFSRIWNRELSQNKINNMYTWYTKRLHEAERVDGQMTRY
tara:strand:- start:26 stop:394 length:369 start_codon:yes stop_codon:yes gene_type:complete